MAVALGVAWMAGFYGLAALGVQPERGFGHKPPDRNPGAWHCWQQLVTMTIVAGHRRRSPFEG